LAATLRMTPGLYWHGITEAAGRGYFEDIWKAASEVKFAPREPPFDAGSNPSNIVDACHPYGSIQVPTGAEPIAPCRDAVAREVRPRYNGNGAGGAA